MSAATNVRPIPYHVDDLDHKAVTVGSVPTALNTPLPPATVVSHATGERHAEVGAGLRFLTGACAPVDFLRFVVMLR